MPARSGPSEGRLVAGKDTVNHSAKRKQLDDPATYLLPGVGRRRGVVEPFGYCAGKSDRVAGWNQQISQRAVNFRNAAASGCNEWFGRCGGFQHDIGQGFCSRRNDHDMAKGLRLTRWLPTIYRTVYHLPLPQTLQYSFVGYFVGLFGALAGILLIDRFGRRPCYIIAFVGAARGK
jgi:hypothetical protein